MPDLPSDEAAEAAAKRAYQESRRRSWDDESDAVKDSWRNASRRDLTAAYAIDLPRVRAATIREAVAWLRSRSPRYGKWGKFYGDALESRFNPEANEDV